MPTNVKLTLWVQCADGTALPESASSVIDLVCMDTARTLQETIPDVLDVSTLNLSALRTSNVVSLRGHCIMVAVKVQRDTLSLDERIELCELVQNAALRELQPLGSLTHVEKFDACFEPYRSVERLG